MPLSSPLALATNPPIAAPKAIPACSNLGELERALTRSEGTARSK
jgi:hypothetical protein